MLSNQQEKTTRPETDQNPMSTDAQANPTRALAELRGEMNLDCETVVDQDRRFGVAVPRGTLVRSAHVEAGIIVGGTDDIAIFIDAEGQQHAERWGVLDVQASGPAWLGDPGEADPFYRIAQRLAALQAEADALLMQHTDPRIRDLADEIGDGLSKHLQDAIETLMQASTSAVSLTTTTKAVRK